MDLHERYGAAELLRLIRVSVLVSVTREDRI
jgi:hypothetical protein